MSHRRRPALAFTGATLFAATTPSFTYFCNVLASTIIGSMSPTELKSFTGAVGDVLRSVADSTSAQWTSATVGKQPAIDTTITPLRSKTDAGQSYRCLQSELTRGSSREWWTAWLYKQPNGEQKLRQMAQRGIGRRAAMTRLSLPYQTGAESPSIALENPPNWQARYGALQSVWPFARH